MTYPLPNIKFKIIHTVYNMLLIKTIIKTNIYLHIIVNVHLLVHVFWQYINFYKT